MMSELTSLVCSVGLLVAAGVLFPFGAAAAEPDVLISTSGEKLIGQLESATATTVTFKSEMGGRLAWPGARSRSFIRHGVLP